MCSCMIRQRSSAGSAYQARVLTNGYTNRYLPCAGRTSSRDSSEYSEGFVIAKNEYGIVHHFISPLCPSTTWNSWIRSRFSAWLSSIMSASPRVPTSEKARSRCPSAKSSQAAMNSRLSAARRSSSSRRQAGSTFRNVYLTNRLCGTYQDDRAELSAGRSRRGSAETITPESGDLRLGLLFNAHSAVVAVFLDLSGGRYLAHRGAHREPD